MRHTIIDLIDFEKINSLLDGFKKTTGLATAILDLEGAVLSHAEWRKLCVDFYQKHHETSNWCATIKIELNEKLAEGENFHIYKCHNGLVEVAIPILIEGAHFANLFSGLFFIEEPDFDTLNTERQQFGFEEKTYNEAIGLIPVIPFEKIKNTMDFLLGTIQFIIEMAFQKAKQMELNDSLAISKLLVESIIDNSPTLIYVADTEGKFKLANKEFQKIFSLPKSEIVGKFREDIMPAAIAEQHRNNDIDVIESRKSILSEEENIESDGKHFYISQKFPLFDLYGNINAVGGISTDITEKIKIEEALRKSKNKYKSLFENSADGILVMNEQSEILELNSKICEILEYPREELALLKGYEFIHPEDLAMKDHAKVLEQLQQGKTVLSQYRLRKKDGSYIPSELSTKMIAEGQFLNIIRDVTERVLAENTIRESEKMLTVIFNNHTDLQLLVRMINENEFRLDAINEPYIRTAANFGITINPEEIIGKPIRTIFETLGLKEEVYDATIIKYKKAASTGKSIHYSESIDVLGLTYTSEITLNPVMDENGKCQYILFNSHNTTEQARTNSALLESEEKFSAAFNSSPVALGISTMQGKYIDANLAFCNLLGYSREEIIYKSSEELELFDDRTREEILEKAATKNGVLRDKEVKLKAKDGSFRYVVYSVETISIAKEKHLLMTAMDITDRKHAEEALKETASNLRSMIDNREDSIWSIDCDFNYIIFNSTYENIINNEHNIKLKKGMSSTEKLTEEQADFWIPKFQSVFDGKNESFEFSHILNGEKRFFRTSLNPIIEDNVVTGASGLSIDITVLKLSEEALILSEKKFEESFRLSPYMVSLSTFDGQIIEVNDRVFATLGYTREEFLGNNTKDLPIWVHLNEREAFANLLIKDEKLHEMEAKFRKKSGEIGDYLLSACIIELNEKKLFLSIVHDITHRKLAEKALINEKNLLSTLIDNIPVMLARYDPNTNVLYLNKEFEDKIGWKTKELETINLLEKVYPDPIIRARAMEHMQKSNSDWEEFLIQSKTGDIYDSEWCNILLNDGTQIGIGIDITEEKKIKAEIIKLNTELENKVKLRTAQLEAINKELGTFTYSVSHDLKAPLRGIDGYSKLLADLYKKDLNQEAQTFIEKIRRSTLQMNQIIDDLLNYSRLERSQLNISKIKIKDLIQTVLAVHNTELEAGYFKIDTKIADIEIMADSKGLVIAFRNLIENAIKFTKGKTNPTIIINIEEKENSWIISVNDNGIGFDMRYHHKIFEIFQRLQRVEDYPGTGIGLALVSKAMQRMNGKTWAESSPNVGSTFYLEIPKNQ